MKIHEYIYGLFDEIDYTFVIGSYPIRIGNHSYHLDSRHVIRLRHHDFTAFPDLAPIYTDLAHKTQHAELSVPCIESLLIDRNFFSKFLNMCTRTDSALTPKLRSLVWPFACIRIRIDHETDLDPMTYIRSIRDNRGIDHARDTFLMAVREFHNFHILTRSPHIYVTDVHCRNIDGMFAYFTTTTGDLLTEVRPLISYWEPKLPRNAAKVAEAFFRNNRTAPIEDLSLARARVYEERQHFTLAIIHAVIALEVVVPKFINEYFALHAVSKSVIDDFHHKFGLSVRVKALLKTILPISARAVIDNAGLAIKYRNDILHEGLNDSSFRSVDVHNLVLSCNKLVEIIRKTSRKWGSNKRLQAIGAKARLQPDP